MKNLKLTERDLRVLKFVYDMKFASSDNLRKMFFEKNEGKTSGERYTLIRLKRLVDEGYLKVFRGGLYKFGFYYIADKGLNLIRNHFRDHLFPKKAPLKIDTRFFEHDYYVACCRIALEKEGLARDWVSERVIIHDVVTKGGEYRSKHMLQNLQKSQIPDGLFETRKGETCAFELELTMKSGRELRHKLDCLDRESRFEDGLFSRVLLVAGSEKIKRTLEKVVSELDASFKVFSIEALLNRESLKSGEAYSPIGERYER